MAVVNTANLLASLAMLMSTRAAAQTPALTLAVATTPRAIWRSQAVEALAADPYSVLTIYAGPTNQNDPVPRYSVQCRTVGTSGEAAMQQAQAMYETLLQSPTDRRPGLPLRGYMMLGYVAVTFAQGGEWLISSVDPRAPGKVGVDDRGRSIVVFNFEIGVYPL